MNDDSQAALYGRGIFTTVAIHNRTLFLWEKHWSRLRRNAERVGVSLAGFSEDRVSATVLEAAVRANITDGRARITFYDDHPSDIWPSDDPHDRNSILSINVGEPRPVPRPFTCVVSPYTINSGSPLAGVKSCNYLENVLAIEDAKRRGFSEAIRLNQRGHVAGACMANVFWLTDGRLFTPSLATGCLPGTTREFVLENTKCGEVEVEIGALLRAEAIFLTSAGLGVVAVDEFNGRRLEAIDHPILDLVPASI